MVLLPRHSLSAYFVSITWTILYIRHSSPPSFSLWYPAFHRMPSSLPQSISQQVISKLEISEVVEIIAVKSPKTPSKHHEPVNMPA